MKFKEIRSDLGLSQKDFSSLFGIPTTTYRKWEYAEEGQNSQGRIPPEYIKSMMLKIIELEDAQKRKSIKTDDTITGAEQKWQTMNLKDLQIRLH